MEQFDPHKAQADSGPDSGPEAWYRDLIEAARAETRRRDLRIEQLERQIGILRQELEQARNRAGDLEAANATLEERQASLGIRLEEANEEMSRMRAELGHSERERRAAVKLGDYNQGELQRLRAENKALMTENEDFARRIRALDQIIDGYVSSNARMRSDFEKLRSDRSRQR